MTLREQPHSLLSYGSINQSSSSTSFAFVLSSRQHNSTKSTRWNQTTDKKHQRKSIEGSSSGSTILYWRRWRKPPAVPRWHRKQSSNCKDKYTIVRAGGGNQAREHYDNVMTTMAYLVETVGKLVDQRRPGGIPPSAERTNINSGKQAEDLNAAPNMSSLW